MSTSWKYLSPLLVVLNILFCQCGKKCQEPAKEPFKSITQTEWRLVETNSQSLGKNLSKTTFPIFAFSLNFEGGVYAVKNNNRPQTPDLLLEWVTSEDKTLRLKYKTPGGEDSGAEVVDYEIDLSNDLTLTRSNGTYLRFIPFTGIYSPDDTCVLN